MNETLETLRAHRSIRKYEEAPLDDAVVREAVAAAQMAATSSNVQGYCCLRVRDRATREQLVELTGGQPQVATAGAFFVIAADQRRHRLIGEAQGRPYRPNLETFLVDVIDASLFAQNLVVAFESMGLGICYIGGLRNRLAEVDELLELPEDVMPLYGLCVGKPAEDPGLRPRLRPEAVLFDDRYPSDDEMREHIAEYDERMRAYYEDRGRSGYDWSGGVARKFATEAREHLAGYYRSKGARLE